MWIYDPDNFKIANVNKAATKMYGYSRDEMLSMTITELRPEREKQRLFDEVNKNINDLNNAGVWEHQTKEGAPLFLEIISHPIKISGKRHKLVTGIDVTERVQLKRQYQSERELLDIIIEKLPGTFFVFNTDGEMLRWNKQLESITGYSSDEIQEKPITSYFDEKDYPKVEKAISKTLEEGQAQIELEAIRKNGERVPLLFNTGSTCYNGQTCIVGIGLDISTLKKLLREKEVLISEIHHRVKNNLALINSLFYLQSTEVKDEHLKLLLNESQARIKIIALIHELLYESDNFTDINFSKHLNRLLDLIQDLYENYDKLDITLDTEELELNINQALPLSLMLNEILSLINRDLKNTDSQELDIRIITDNDNIQLKLKYSGELPFINSEADEHLGDLLISVLSDQLEADCFFNIDQGSHCHIAFERQSSPGSIAGDILELV